MKLEMLIVPRHLIGTTATLVTKGYRAQSEQSRILGDLVLGLIVAETAIRRFPHLDSGTLTSIISSLCSAQGLNVHFKILLTEVSDLLVEGLTERNIGEYIETTVGYNYAKHGLEYVRKSLTPIVTAKLEEIIQSDEPLFAIP